MPVNVETTERYFCETMRNTLVFIAFSDDKPRAFKEIMAAKIKITIFETISKENVLCCDPHHGLTPVIYNFWEATAEG